MEEGWSPGDELCVDDGHRRKRQQTFYGHQFLWMKSSLAHKTLASFSSENLQIVIKTTQRRNGGKKRQNYGDWAVVL